MPINKKTGITVPLSIPLFFFFKTNYFFTVHHGLPILNFKHVLYLTMQPKKFKVFEDLRLETSQTNKKLYMQTNPY